MSLNARDKAAVLVEALPWLEQFQGATMVVKFGGNAMVDETLLTAFAQDIAFLRLSGIHPVVVHGGGPQIDNALKKIGKQGSFVQGMRITDEETMEVVEWVLAGEVQQDIVGLINRAGGKAGRHLRHRPGDRWRFRTILQNQKTDIGLIDQITSTPRKSANEIFNAPSCER